MSTTTTQVQDYQHIVDQARDALAGLRSQVEEIEQRITMRRAQIAGIEEQITASRAGVHEAEAAIPEAEQRVRTARAAANVTIGTGLAASAGEQLQAAENELALTQENAKAAREQHAKTEKRCTKEQSALSGLAEQDQTALPDLERQISELERVYTQAHAELGRATFSAYGEEMREKLDQVARLEDDLAGEQLSLMNLQDEVTRLSAWPELLKKARQEVIPASKAEPPSTVQLTRALVRYLQKLAEHGQQIEATPNTNITRAKMHFQVPGSLVEQAALGNPKLIHAWIDELKEFERQLLQQEQDRAAMRRGYY